MQCCETYLMTVHLTVAELSQRRVMQAVWAALAFSKQFDCKAWTTTAIQLACMIPAMHVPGGSPSADTN